MATRKLKKSSVRKSPKKGGFDFSFPGLPEIPETISREIFVVSFFSGAILIALALWGQLGPVGDALEYYFSMYFGVGKFLIPILLGGVAVSKIISAQIRFGAGKNIGLTLMLLSVLGIIHLITPYADAELFASNGQFGGYLGHLSSILFRMALGGFGTFVILSAILVISVLLTFEISLSQLLSGTRQSETDEELVSAPAPRKSSSRAVGSAPVADTPMTRTEVRPFGAGSASTIKIRRGGKDSSSKPDKGFQIKTPVFNKDSKWEAPSLDLLVSSEDVISVNDNLLQSSAEKIREKLMHFGIGVEMKEAHIGPTVTQFTLKPAPNVKLQNILSLAKDLKLALSARSIRIEAPIPGQSLVGIEVPNQQRAIIRIREILASAAFSKTKSNLRLVIGQDVSGKAIVGDLKKMPHLLIAGQTGSGKSVFINNILLSLLYQNSPNDLKLILVDPKRVELMPYGNIPHLLTPVITEVEKTASALRWLLAEMTRRYKLFQEKKVRNLEEFNGSFPEEKIPNIVLIVDELSDLMMMAGKEVEPLICRLAQMARATGIHLILATQRPSVNVITGLIKANIPSRMSFTVASGMDSRTIIDSVGAENLLDSGDMLYLPSGASSPTRIQAVYISTEEVTKVVNFIKLSDDSMPEYADLEVRKKIEIPGVTSEGGERTTQQSIEIDDSEEPRLQEVIDLISESGKASASLLQRRLQFGYARAARSLDILEDKGLIGPSEGAKPRKILFDAGAGQIDDTSSEPKSTIVSE